MPKFIHYLLKSYGLSLGLIVALLTFWEISIYQFDIPQWKLPAPSAIFIELKINYPLFLSHTKVTAFEAIAGFLIALILGITLALIISVSQLMRRAIYPIIISSQTIPTIVVAPLLLIWIGYGLTPKIVTVVLLTFFPIVVSTVDGLRSVDRDIIRVMLTTGASPYQIFFKVRLPASLPSIFSGMKISATFCVIGAVVGEWIGSSEGLGYLTRVSVPLFLTARSFAAVLILALMGVGFFLLISLIEFKMLKWKKASEIGFDKSWMN